MRRGTARQRCAVLQYDRWRTCVRPKPLPVQLRLHEPSPSVRIVGQVEAGLRGAREGGAQPLAMHAHTQIRVDWGARGLRPTVVRRPGWARACMRAPKRDAVGQAEHGGTHGVRCIRYQAGGSRLAGARGQLTSTDARPCAPGQPCAGQQDGTVWLATTQHDSPRSNMTHHKAT